MERKTLDMNVEAGLSPQRILAYLSTLFAALATLLASIGLYGVLASALGVDRSDFQLIRQGRIDPAFKSVDGRPVCDRPFTPEVICPQPADTGTLLRRQ
jgi:hypothetical protein